MILFRVLIVAVMTLHSARDLGHTRFPVCKWVQKHAGDEEEQRGWKKADKQC